MSQPESGPSSTPFQTSEFVDRLEKMNPEEQKLAFEALTSRTQKKKVNQEIASREAARKAAATTTAEESEDEEVVFTPAPTAPGTSEKGKEKQISKEEISETEMQDMWSKIDILDVSTIDPEALRVFEYEGFNPDMILRTLLMGKKRNNVTQSSFLSDILIMCGMAIIKGTVNERNFKKMKKQGQDEFVRLESTYGLVRGGGRNLDAEKVNVSRIAATFPGKVLQLLQAKKVTPREYYGPMKSSSLPAVIRHQALAACIPRNLPEQTRNYFLGLITAFSVDQSIVISAAKKPDVEKLLLDQGNFIRVAHSGKYPPEAIRVTIFRQYDWTSMFDDLQTCAKALKKADDTFILIDKAQFRSDINSL